MSAAFLHSSHTLGTARSQKSLKSGCEHEKSTGSETRPGLAHVVTQLLAVFGGTRCLVFHSGADAEAGGKLHTRQRPFGKASRDNSEQLSLCSLRAETAWTESLQGPRGNSVLAPSMDTGKVSSMAAEF